jgi:hypothetical protein
MQPEYFKLQTPLHASDSAPTVLLYNESHSVWTLMSSALAEQLITDLGLKRVGDKAYVQAIFVDGEFIANKDTLTRAPEQIGINW